MGKVPVLGQAGGGEKLLHVAVTSRQVYGTSTAAGSFTEHQCRFYMPVSIDPAGHSFKLYVGDAVYKYHEFENASAWELGLNCGAFMEVGGSTRTLSIPFIRSDNNQSGTRYIQIADTAPEITYNSVISVSQTGGTTVSPTQLRCVYVNIMVRTWVSLSGGPSGVMLPVQLRIFE